LDFDGQDNFGRRPSASLSKKTPTRLSPYPLIVLSVCLSRLPPLARSVLTAALRRDPYNRARPSIAVAIMEIPHYIIYPFIRLPPPSQHSVVALRYVRPSLAVAIMETQFRLHIQSPPQCLELNKQDGEPPSCHGTSKEVPRPGGLSHLT
jgi:hypothetical protein